MSNPDRGEILAHEYDIVTVKFSRDDDPANDCSHPSHDCGEHWETYLAGPMTGRSIDGWDLVQVLDFAVSPTVSSYDKPRTEYRMITLWRKEVAKQSGGAD